MLDFYNEMTKDYKIHSHHPTPEKKKRGLYVIPTKNANDADPDYGAHYNQKGKSSKVWEDSAI